MIRLNKKSQIHVEMILSFILFTGFVFFALVFLNPLTKERSESSILEQTYSKIIQNVSINYEGFSVYYPVTDDTNCFSVAGDINLTGNLIVYDSFGNIKESQIVDKDNLKIKSSRDSNFYRLYFSERFDDSYAASLNDCDTLDSSIGPKSYNTQIFYPDLVALNDYYAIDYEKTKENLEIDNEFDFVVYDINRKVLLNKSREGNRIVSGNVFSREIPIRVIYENASQSDLILNLRVWD